MEIVQGIGILILWVAILGMIGYHTINYNEDTH